MKLSKIAAALPYAHLLGISAAATAEENDEKKQRPDESDDDYAKRMEQEDKKEGDDESEKDLANAKGAADSDEDNEEIEDDEEQDKEKAVRLSERARCAAIFGAKSAGVRPDVAAHLAFQTDMSSKEAVAMLDTIAAGDVKPRNLASRMSTVSVPNVGPGSAAPDASNPAATAAAKIIEAGKKRRGEN